MIAGQTRPIQSSKGGCLSGRSDLFVLVEEASKNENSRAVTCPRGTQKNAFRRCEEPRFEILKGKGVLLRVKRATIRPTSGTPLEVVDSPSIDLRDPSAHEMPSVPPLLEPSPRGPCNQLHHQAAQDGSVERTLALLSSGSINIDEGNPGGWTPLMYATDKGCLRVIRILLDNGAKINLVADGGVHALSGGLRADTWAWSRRYSRLVPTPRRASPV